jgi:hypothetical protein
MITDVAVAQTRETWQVFTTHSGMALSFVRVKFEGQAICVLHLRYSAEHIQRLYATVQLSHVQMRL